MPKKSFEVIARWDEDASVWFSESDIIGLHIETETLEEFRREVEEHAADLVVANHINPEDINAGNIRDLIPAIFWREGRAA